MLLYRVDEFLTLSTLFEFSKLCAIGGGGEGWVVQRRKAEEKRERGEGVFSFC